MVRNIPWAPRNYEIQEDTVRQCLNVGEYSPNRLAESSPHTFDNMAGIASNAQVHPLRNRPAYRTLSTPSRNFVGLAQQTPLTSLVFETSPVSFRASHSIQGLPAAMRPCQEARKLRKVSAHLMLLTKCR
jgi:hypothetical protein